VKKSGIILVAAVTMLMSASLSWAVISGSSHDMSTKTWNASGQICIVCHTPHNAATGTNNLVPLWNHASTTATFAQYVSTSFQGSTDAGRAVGAVSKACLSCHDGTVALDSFGGSTAATSFIGAGANIGTNLANDHPISFAYTTALATSDGGLVSPTDLTQVTAGIPLYGGSGQLECASCHDVHNKASVGSLLRVSNAGSALCFKCHSK
jgi:predicted CXXCH cytochrome family protein